MAKVKCYICNLAIGGKRGKHNEYTCVKCYVALALEKARAHSAVAYAVRSGKLKNLKAHEVDCVDCGARAECYDHRDYKQPLLVDPVCEFCDSDRGMAAPYREMLAKYIETHPGKFVGRRASLRRASGAKC